MIPGRTLHRLAVMFCSPAFAQRVIEPLLADLQHEWLRTQRFRERLSILASGYSAFWCTFVLHAARAWRDEILGMTWRDAFPFPGVLAITAVSINLAGAWVRTGTVMTARFDNIDTRNLWLMVPVFVIHRWLPIDSGVRAVAVHAVAFAAFYALLEQMEGLRPFMRGGMAFVVFLVVVTLVQSKKSRAVQ
jgi:hypothetical protein